MHIFYSFDGQACVCRLMHSRCVGRIYIFEPVFAQCTALIHSQYLQHLHTILFSGSTSPADVAVESLLSHRPVHLTCQVEPFASLAGAVRGSVSRLLINRDLVGPFARGSRRHNDVAELGDVVGGVKKLVELLGWKQELEALMNVGGDEVSYNQSLFLHV